MDKFKRLSSYMESSNADAASLNRDPTLDFILCTS